MPEDKLPMKVVGGRNMPSYWERWSRLQRRAQMLLGRPVSPKGVFAFKTHEEFEAWKEAYRDQELWKKQI